MNTKLQYLSTILFLQISILCNVFTQSPFISSWQTTEAEESITIPTFPGEVYNYEVDWGDGTTTDGHTATASHVYESPGEYQISITGIFPRIYFNREGDKDKIISIDQWGTQVWTSMASAFYGCEKLGGQANDVPVLSDVQDMSRIFAYCKNFNQDIGDWDVSGVVNMKEAFLGTRNFNQNIGSWDVSNVTNMSGMFNSSKHYLDIGDWDVSNVTDMSWMFSNTHQLHTINIGKWDVSNVTNMSYMFRSSAYNEDELGDWDVSSVTDMSGMFYEGGHNHSIESWDVSNVEKMYWMFYKNTGFNKDIGSWDVSNVTDMSGMFEWAEQFNQDIGIWNVSNVKNMSFMFKNAYSFNQDISLWDVSNVYTMKSMFSEAYVFNQDISQWDVGNVTDMEDMFVSARAFNQNIDEWDVSKVNNMESMFRAAISFDQNLGSWDISKVSNMESMFKYIGISTQNYDSTLIGWASLPLQTGIEFDAGSSSYCESETARQYIINTFGWTIDDGGKDEDCISSSEDLRFEEIKLFPNPSSKILNINYDPIRYPELSIRLFDSLGILRKHIHNVEIINIYSMDPGIYFIAFYLEGIKLGTKSFIKL